MLSLTLRRLRDRGMEPLLPFKSLALFYRVKRVKRGDVVLADTREYGLIVRKVRAVSVNGRVALRRMSRADGEVTRLDNVNPERVLGKLAFGMRWVRFLPYFGPPPIFALRPLATHDASKNVAHEETRDAKTDLAKEAA